MEAPFKVIKTETEYRAALARFEALLEPEEEDRSYDDLELLSVLIEKYEDEYYPIDPPDPVEAIKFRMEQANLTQKDLIPYIGSRSKVSEVLSGKRELTLAMIRSLNTHLGIPLESLIHKPQEPLPKAMEDMDFSKFPLYAMEKCGAFSGFEYGETKLQEKSEEAIRWMVQGIGGFSMLPRMAARKTDGMRLNVKLDNYALLAWSLLVLKEAAEHRTVGIFDPARLNDKFIETLVSLSVLDEGPKHAQEYLGKAGILLIIKPHLSHTYLDGAVFLTETKRPIIATTLRYDRTDNFWFVLLHELGHLKLGHLNNDQNWIADDLDLPNADSEQEMAADRFAAESLLPRDFDLDSRERLSTSDVIDYAKDHGIHPAIVAGRIQHSKKDFRTFAKLLGRGEVRKLFQVIGGDWSKSSHKEDKDA
jgi:HTH-type transcriptional regulator/antitoxin HigA